MEIAGYEFKGPFTDTTRLPLDASAVYVVVCLDGDEPQRCLDVDATRQLGERLRSHDRRPCWENNCDGDIGYYYRSVSGTWDRNLDPNPLTLTSADSRPERLGILSELQWQLDPVCGSNPWQTIEDYWETHKQYETTFGERGSETLGE